jgi:hypothetical protein
VEDGAEELGRTGVFGLRAGVRRRGEGVGKGQKTKEREVLLLT